ncbi:MAG: N-6 DNA methylase [Gammaproteobacteria bacterium]|nr:N-6 DNA methylase [Gammaproteobacteria bacterium]
MPDGKICDYIDGKFRKDTPEEYVRQTIEKRLVNEHKYEVYRIKIEHTLKLGSRRPRADIVIFSSDSTSMSQDDIHLIIECKSETIDPKDKKDGVEQLKSYMSVCPNCKWGMWTNGRYKEVLYKNTVGNKVVYQDYNDIPPGDGSLEDIDRPKRNNLKKAFEDNLVLVFRTCHNYIYGTDGLQKQPAFFELLKLIFCKTLDEQNVGRPLEFYATSKERSNPDGQLTVKTRISSIFEQVKAQFPQIFQSRDEISLNPRSLSWIVSELQPYSLLDTHVDVKGRAYEELVGANLRGDRGEFFTPRNITKMIVEMINPQPHETVCDPACGTGGFLVSALNHVTQKLYSDVETDYRKEEIDWTDNQRKLFRDRIREIARRNFFGFDINPDLVKATKMNMVMNNDGSGNIYRTDSLLPPHEWHRDFKLELCKALNIEIQTITNQDSLGLFDVIVTNPPFGSNIKIKGSHILGQFNLGHLWRENPDANGPEDQFYMSDELQSAVPPEQLFIERCLQMLKPGGRLAIVLPDSILSNPGLSFIRQWLISKGIIVASIDLHVDTFQPRNGTQTSVLVVQKNELAELSLKSSIATIKPYNIFMAIVEKIGHDKRGNTLWKRDELGNEIWVPETNNILNINRTASGAIAATTATKRRIRDDASTVVPPIFNEWKKEEGLSW